MMKKINGTGKKDKIVVKTNRVVVKALGGNDTIIVKKSSNSKVYGNLGNDKININGGRNNRVFGGNGNDVIIIRKTAGLGNKVFGGNGNDKLYGNQHNNHLSGGSGNDLLKGYAGNDTLYGGKGNDRLYGGAGKDTFWYESGNDIIYDYRRKQDTIRIKGTVVNGYRTSGKNVVLGFKNGGTLTLKNMAGKEFSYIDKNKVAQTRTVYSSPLYVMRSFMQSLSDYSYSKKTIRQALDAAVNFASAGKFKTWNGLLNSFVGNIREHGYNGGECLNASPDEDPVVQKYLKKYYGIDLANKDRGAITGKDAGGRKVKDLEGIIPEPGTIRDIKTPTKNSTKIRGVTFHWAEPTNKDQKFMQDCLHTWWASQGLKLIKDSYGIDFNSKNVSVKDIYVEFKPLGKVTNARIMNYWDGEKRTTHLVLQINTDIWKNLDKNDTNGKKITAPGDFKSNCLDSLAAHEFTHAVMSANIKDYASLPLVLKEGAAVLTVGGDGYGASIGYAANKKGAAELSRSLKSDKKTGLEYYGGYMLLRYFAKQSSDYINGSMDTVVKEIKNDVLAFPDTSMNSSAEIPNPCVSNDTSSFFAVSTSPVRMSLNTNYTAV